MTAKAVEAVFFAKYTASNFRALYGRLTTDEAATYTKDFLQVLQLAGDTLAAPLSASRTTGADIVYVWPTGRCNGKFIWRDPRWQMKWLTNQKPLPWTIGVGTTTEISITGDPSHQSPAQADAVYESIIQSGIEPWLLAVKLVGEDRTLHVRTYFRNPTPQFADRALGQLPTVVLNAIDALPTNEGSGTVVLPPATQLGPRPEPRAKNLVTQLQDALAQNPNVLLVGPPGTGKSVALEDLQALYSHSSPAGAIYFDSATWGNSWSVARESRSESLVFHPSYSYENFVASLFPKTTQGGGMELVARPGPLLCLSHWIGTTNRQALLILDEFNRGPAAAIFGDTLSLLDGDKRSTNTTSGTHIQRPYPSQEMPVPKAYAHDPLVSESISDQVRLPAGLHIVAAMNSTDRSVAPLDAAMRRRFTVIRVRPDYDALSVHLGTTTAQLSQALPTEGDPENWPLESVSVLAIRLLQNLNERIEYCLGEDFLLGHALVWNMNAATPRDRLIQLATAVDTKIVPTLRMTFVDQDEALAAVLAIADDMQVHPGQLSPDATVAFWKSAPASLASIAQRRLVLQSVRAMPGPKQLTALMALARS